MRLLGMPMQDRSTSMFWCAWVLKIVHETNVIIHLLSENTIAADIDKLHNVFAEPYIRLCYLFCGLLLLNNEMNHLDILIVLNHLYYLVCTKRVR